MKIKVALVLCDVRSAHNVGSILRTADGLGIDEVYLTGITPYPQSPNDDRLPHVRKKVEALINKTALGAQNSVNWHHDPDPEVCIKALKKAGYKVAALEQTPDSLQLSSYSPDSSIALAVGNEVDGLSANILDMADVRLEMPMKGTKESFNVSVAAAIALYHLTVVAKRL